MAKQKTKQHQHNSAGSSKQKAKKDKKIIGKRVNKKQISCQVKEAVERTNACNTDLYDFYAQRCKSSADSVTMVTASEANAASPFASNERHQLIEQVNAAFNPKFREAEVSKTVESLQQIALLNKPK